MQGKYPDSISKISLTLAVGQAAKTQVVKEHGIGEELALNIFGWRDDELVCVAQMDTSFMSDEDEKIERTHDAYNALRRGWHCDSFTILAEGYMSKNPELTRDKNLVEAFLDPKSGVNECLTINYVDEKTIDLCAIPFKVKLGKKVTWGALVHSEDPTVLRNNEYISEAQEILNMETSIIPEDIDTFHLAISVGLHETAGYFLQYDF